jgi:hypothetical protein
LKITLIVVGVFALLLVVGIGGLGYFWYQSTQKVAEEAKTFAQQTDQAGCLKGAMARQKQDDSLLSVAGNAAFLKICLDNCRPTSGFCEGMPPSSDQQQTVQWVKGQCQSSGLTEPTCTTLMTVAQQHCETSTRQK